MEKIAYSVKEVAQMLGVSKSYMYRLVNEKKFPVLEVGGRKVIPKSYLETWISENVTL